MDGFGQGYIAQAVTAVEGAVKRLDIGRDVNRSQCRAALKGTDERGQTLGECDTCQ